jgi:type IV secretory pathway TraG/TraD family ATPase VirD4
MNATHHAPTSKPSLYERSRRERRLARALRTREPIPSRPTGRRRHDGPEHVLCFAPTGSGKGVGLVVPTLLTWPHSVLVYDIKRENWALTAGWRRQFSRVWRFEPTAEDSVRFNPLMEVRKGRSEVKDVQNIADMLVDPTGEKETRDHCPASTR